MKNSFFIITTCVLALVVCFGLIYGAFFYQESIPQPFSCPNCSVADHIEVNYEKDGKGEVCNATIRCNNCEFQYDLKAEVAVAHGCEDRVCYFSRVPVQGTSGSAVDSMLPPDLTYAKNPVRYF
jgi:hypothetical protein